MRLIDPKTFRLELDKLDCIDKFGYVILPITKLNIALERSAVDAVPVVRCKDCVKREICRTSNIWAVAPSDDWFCADGEREGEAKRNDLR